MRAKQINKNIELYKKGQKLYIEKQWSLTKISKELQEIPGFEELLRKYNFGDNIDFTRIKAMKRCRYKGFAGVGAVAYKAMSLALNVLI